MPIRPPQVWYYVIMSPEYRRYEILSRPAHFRAETIVRELLHLKVPNHGKSFEQLSKALLTSEQPTKTKDEGTHTKEN